MKQFQFSLNTVLGVRSNEEQLAAERHATAQEALEVLLLQRRLVEERPSRATSPPANRPLMGR
jgi:hypothetical protein